MSYNSATLISVLLLFLSSESSSENVSLISCEYRRMTDPTTHLASYIGDCSGMSLSFFPKVWDEVNILDLAENKIAALDSKQTKLSSRALKKLLLSFNEISRLSPDFFDDVPELTELNLSYNNISSLDSKVFQNLGKLSKLDLSFNGLVSLPSGIFGPLPSLKFLDMSYNYLGTFLTSSKNTMRDVMKINKDLNHLGLNGLNLTYIDSTYFDEYKNLKSLSLADNAFENVPIIPYSTEVLDLSGNRLTYVSARYLNYHSLKELKLNRMSSLTSIHHYAFYNLYSLEKLFINDCPNLKEFNELAFDLASKNYHLHPKVLSLTRNGLQTLNQSYEYFFHNMYIVDLGHNPWRCDCNILWLKRFESKIYKSHELR